MRIENENDSTALIGKYLAGEASPEEAMALQDWLEDPENKKEYNRLLSICNTLPASAAGQEPDPAFVFRELEQAIATTRKRKYFPLWPWPVAAAITGLAILLTFMLIPKRKTNLAGLPKNQPALFTKKATGSPLIETLPDGTTVTLNKNTVLTYDAAFNHSVREVMLSGEAFFDVKEDRVKLFLVIAGEVKIKVVGTSFNVQGVNGGKKVEVSVQSGTVKMYTTQDEIIITKGKTGIYLKEIGQLSLKDTLDMNHIGYATRTFAFNDAPLTEVKAYLENAFNVTIRLENKNLADCRITAQFENKPLDYILDIMSATLNTTYRKKGNIVLINGKGCQ